VFGALILISTTYDIVKQFFSRNDDSLLNTEPDQLEVPTGEKVPLLMDKKAHNAKKEESKSKYCFMLQIQNTCTL
jgi:hypothetical protein